MSPICVHQLSLSIIKPQHVTVDRVQPYFKIKVLCEYSKIEMLHRIRFQVSFLVLVLKALLLITLLFLELKMTYSLIERQSINASAVSLITSGCFK